jgi:hypothetical protein
MKDDDLGNMLPNVVRDTNDCAFFCNSLLDMTCEIALRVAGTWVQEKESLTVRDIDLS